MPGDSTQKPGPGAHSPEKVSVLTTLSLLTVAAHLTIAILTLQMIKK